MVEFQCHAISDRGDLETNEDYVVSDPAEGIFVVADGMGGRAGGAEASENAIKVFVNTLYQVGPAVRMQTAYLRSAVDAANSKLRALAAGDPVLEGMGTTLSALVTHGRAARVVHVGDSRIYLFRNGELNLLTRDHTLVAELVEGRHISEETAERSRLRNVLSRCIGVSETVEADIKTIELADGDWFLLATDGLTKGLKNKILQRMFLAEQQRNPKELCEYLVRAALENDSRDNVTAALIKVHYFAESN